MIDPRLVADTHVVSELQLSQLLLMDDARFPWLILVPRIAGAREFIDLDAGDQQILHGEISQVARALEQMYKPDKLNIASLGNVVTQLHIHVIARRADDAAWPQPVWNVGEREPYSSDAAHARLAELRSGLASMSS
jgi:diadenosine tetraphosphate (Ap4A) HIT family hydrolase